MSAIIEVGTQSGVTLYAFVRNSSGQIWNGSAFESYNVSNWLSYDLAMTEDTSSGYYKVSFPSSISSGKYSFFIYQQGGGAPAAGDPIISQGFIYWDGSTEDQGIAYVLKSYKLDQFISTAASPSSPTASSFLDKLMNKNGGQTFDPTTDSLEAIKDAGGGGPTAADIADAVWDEVLTTSHTVSDSAAERLKAVDDKLPSGTISDFDESINNVNLSSNQAGVTIGTVNAFGSTATGQINSEVVDVLRVDSISELSAGVPPATPTIVQALMYLYMTWRNQTTESTTQSKVRNNAGTVIATATLSDNGSEFTKGQYS